MIKNKTQIPKAIGALFFKNSLVLFIAFSFVLDVHVKNTGDINNIFSNVSITAKIKFLILHNIEITIATINTRRAQKKFTTKYEILRPKFFKEVHQSVPSIDSKLSLNAIKLDPRRSSSVPK